MLILRKTTFLFFLLSLGVVGCKTKNSDSSLKDESASVKENEISSQPFGIAPDGQQVSLYTLKNKNGIEAGVINYGGIIVYLKTPDKSDQVADIVLGYDSLSSYISGNPYFGALIGRYGNRIANGKFKLDGVEYSLAQNDGENHLHGGVKGFDKVYWNIEPLDSINALKLTYTSKDGEEGYPGKLAVEVIYTLTEDNELKIDYKATSDKKTIVNLTQHTYFNLTGDASKNILGHQLMLDSDTLLPVGKSLIPTGQLLPVQGTPFDFKTPIAIGARINSKHQQLAYGQGYDHCWVLNNKGSLRTVASVYDSTSGRFMEVQTTEPGIQFYSGNFLNGENIGKGGIAYQQRSGFCLETQHYPDSPNQSSFPSVVLNPGETYATTTIYKFSTK